ncbi:MAG: M23 family metallopeptidase [Desulfuromonadales bacterium]|nr:M23 family metallopeptidase [Desulfuromonadales bacterium]MDT8423476.1 M23 family metallopeptidase [Desulfuromonadales bacterium]
MSRLFVIILLSLLVTPVWGQELTIVPQQPVNGGVAMIRWQGEKPSSAVARFADRIFYLQPVEDGAIGILGVDVGLLAGDYPLTVAVVDRHGQTTFNRQRITVRDAGRPEERLTVDPELVSPQDPATLRRIAAERAVLAEIFAGQRSASLWPKLQLPVANPVSSQFGLRRVFNGEPKSAHSGTDFRSPRGTPVHPALDGIVALTAEYFYTGNTVVVDHGEGLFTLYAHLESIAVQVGSTVTPATTLGRVGSTGRSTGPHLHWTARLHGALVDPLELLALWNRERP